MNVAFRFSPFAFRFSPFAFRLPTSDFRLPTSDFEKICFYIQPDLNYPTKSASMLIDSREFDQLLYLADQLEDGDHFEMNIQSFIRLSERMKERLYRSIDDPDVLDALDDLPIIEMQAYRRSFLEQMLPHTGRDMVGKHKNREVIRGQVRQIVDTLTRVRRWLGEDEGYV